MGNRDINAVDDSAKAYMLDTYTISHMGRMDGISVSDGMISKILDIERLQDPVELDEPPIEVPDSEYFEANQDAFQELADWYL